jgi:small subunit ribosomal protein S19
MSRSIKKGPFIDYKLEKRVLEMNEGVKKSVIKTWSRRFSKYPLTFVGIQ